MSHYAHHDMFAPAQSSNSPTAYRQPYQALLTQSREKMSVEGWPSEAQPLRKGTFERIFSILSDTISIIVPLGFLAVSIMGKILDKKPIQGYTWGLELISVNKYLTTAYPILFAAIVGRAVNLIGDAFLERGATVMFLEQLFGSTAVAATVKTQLSLRAVNFTAVTLIILWAFSPLGGQAVLRLVNVQDYKLHFEQGAQVMDTTGFSSLKGDPGYYIPSLNAVYLAAIIAPNETQTGPQDTWGNVKVPFLQDLNGIDQSITGQKNVSYSSLIGIPVAGLGENQNSSFVMTTSYLSLNCPQGPQVVPYENELLWFSNNTARYSQTGQVVAGNGCSRYSTSTNAKLTTWSIGSFATDDPYSDPPNLYFQFDNAAPDDITTITTLNCTVENHLVDSRVECVGELCTVIGIQPSTNGNSTMTAALFDYVSIPFFYCTFTDASGYINTQEKYQTSSLVEQYVYYGSSPIGQSNFVEPKNLSHIPANMLAERLSRVLNTFWIASLEPTIVTGERSSQGIQYTDGTSSYTPFNALGIPNFSAGFSGPASNVTTTVTRVEQLFICNNSWFLILLLSAIALLICAVAGAYLNNFFIQAPSLVGHVSSLTRDNMYMVDAIPPGGTTLGGFERARLLRNLRIQLGDARASDPAAGYIALMGGRRDVDRLEKARKYS